MLQMVAAAPSPRGGVFPTGALANGRDVIAGQLVQRAQAALDADLDAARDLLRQLATMLTPQLVRDEADAEQKAMRAKTIARGGLAAWQMKAVNEHIQRNLSETIHIDALASVTRLSTSHFCRAFKTSFGMTAHSYIMRQRLEQARLMMLTTTESLCHIAAACGMADQAHLTRLFRRHMGDTPFNWRRTWRQAS
jgi:transcriptional regulator GlxA family with amidase domain